METTAKRVIKRYSNRKLYDTKGSRYVTLLQIAEIVRGGEEVQIIDNNSKEDLTEVTLAQIIFEEQKANQKTLPLQTLRELIHTRTEGVLSQLREGPIGRLIPGASKDPKDVKESPKDVKDVKVEAPSSPPADKESKPAPPRSLVDQAKGTIEDSIGAGRSWAQDFQHRIDERVKALMPTAPWAQMQKDMKQLQARVEALETELSRVKGESGSGEA